MKVKFELVNTEKGIEVETFFFEVNNFEEFKKQIEICTLSNKFWGGEEIAEEIEGFASAMTDIYKKISELNSKYGNESSEFEEELVEHLKKKFPEQYKLSLEDLKNDGSDDPEMEMTPGRFVDHIGDKSDELLKEYETILKKLNGE